MDLQSDIIFIGGGMNNPSVVAFNVNSHDTKRLLNLPPLNSVYAMDLNLMSSKLAIGTKGGLVYIVSTESNQIANKDSSAHKLFQGAPVLSVCWISKSYLAVSDTAGRCLLWHTNMEKSPQVLGTFNDVICCLLSSDDKILAGLAAKGKLYFWEASEGELIKTINVPSTPSISGLVKMVYWQEENVLVFPNYMGGLTLFELEKDRVKNLDAHKGDLYAISMCGDKLLTIGMQDRRLKIWRNGSNESVCDLMAPDGVVSLAVAGDQYQKLLIVDVKGSAAVYYIEDDNLQLVTQVHGGYYRVASAPAPDKIHKLIVQQNENEAYHIINKIQDNVGKVNENTINKLHDRLIELGYEHVSLDIRVDHAYKNGDIIGSLYFSFSLMQILPKDNAYICESMKRYAALLEKTWHISEADVAFKYISSINPDFQFDENTDYFAKIANIIRENHWVIEPDIPIDQIIDSSTIIKKQFYGRYVIRKFDSKSCRSVNITAEMIAEKYELLRNESDEPKLPPATTEQVWWISREEIEQIQIVTFVDEPNHKGNRLQFALQVLDGDQGTLVVPVILFDYRNIEPNSSIEVKNKEALKEFSKIKQSPLSANYLTSVHQALIQALRILVTKGLSKRGICK